MNRFCHEPRHYEHTPNNKSASVWVPPCVTWPHAFNFLFNELQPYTMARLRQTRMRRTSQTNAHTAKRRRNNTIPESNKNKFRRGMQPHEDLTTAASSSTTFLLNGLFSVRIVSEALAQCNVIALCMVRVSRTVLAAKTLYDRGRRRASWSVASPPPGECNKSKQNERQRESTNWRQQPQDTRWACKGIGEGIRVAPVRFMFPSALCCFFRSLPRRDYWPSFFFCVLLAYCMLHTDRSHWCIDRISCMRG